MGDVAHHTVLHAEPGEDLQTIDQRDASGIETVELRAEQAGDDDLGHVPDNTPNPLSGRAYAGAARDFRDVGVVVLGPTGSSTCSAVGLSSETFSSRKRSCSFSNSRLEVTATDYRGFGPDGKPHADQIRGSGPPASSRM